MKICYGIKNSHEPLFFKSFISRFTDAQHEQTIIARNYIEVVPLLEQIGLPFITIGKHYGGNKIKKMIGAIINVFLIFFKAPEFDVSISHANTYLIYASKLRRKKTITFTDNDLSFNLSTYKNIVDYLFTPKSIPRKKLLEIGCSEEKLYQYDGFKEDIYIADYVPNKEFLTKLPFDKFVTVRAESIHAHYVPTNTVSIVPELFQLFKINKINVLFLPRYDSDKNYAKGFDNVFMPEKPLNGLDVCYYSDVVLTGAGTFAREAAIIGTPAVSFFPREELLSVDTALIKENKIIHSRNPQEILKYVLENKDNEKSELDLSRSKKVQDEIFVSLSKILEKD